MKYYRITKRVMFCAAHSIKGAGKCENKHGHNWEATITVDSSHLDNRGFIADVAQLKQAAFQYDHDDLDKYFEQPTTEIVADKIADDALQIVLNNLARAIDLKDPDVYIGVDVNLVETENNSAQAHATYMGSQL